MMAIGKRRRISSHAAALATLLVIIALLNTSFESSILFQQQGQQSSSIQAFGQQQDEEGTSSNNNSNLISGDDNKNDDGGAAINLSNDNGTSSFFMTAEDVSSNAMIAASGNNVYAVWVDNSTGLLGSYDIFFARSADGGDSFDSPVDLSTPIRNNGSTYGNSYSPQIAVSGNNVYVTWIESVYAPSQDRQDTHILFLRSDDGGSTFQGPIDISGGTSGIPEPESLSLAYPLYSSNPQIAVSRDDDDYNEGTVYVVWTVHPLIIPATDTQQQEERVGEGDIFFTRIGPDGSSTEPVNLSNNTGESRFPRIGLSGSNDVYVAWADDTYGDGEIFFRHISDNGSTLGPVVNISSNYFQDDKPQIAADRNNVYAIWQNYGKNETGGTVGAIGFASSQDNGTTFGEPMLVMTTKIDPAIGPLHNLATISTAAVTTAGRNLDQTGNVSSNGNNNNDDDVFVVWSDGTIGNRDIYFSKNNATSNDSPFFPYYYWTISDNAGESLLPEIAVSGSGNVYVVWMDNASGTYEIYFREANFTTTTKTATNGNNDFEVTFSDTINISNTTGNSMFPQIAAEGNNVYVAWEEYASDGENPEIYFKRIER